METYVQNIVTLITQYTSELESLDHLNNTYIMTCVGFVGVLLGIIVSLMGMRRLDKVKEIYSTINKMIASLFIAIPLVACVFICVTTMNCRKVAVYRGYLVYLENQYNSVMYNLPQKLNIEAHDFLSKWSIRNKNGSMMNASIMFVCIVVLTMLMTVCFIAAFVYLKQSTKSGEKQKLSIIERAMYGMFILIVVVYVVISAASIYDLCLHNVSSTRLLSYLTVT